MPCRAGFVVATSAIGASLAHFEGFLVKARAPAQRRDTLPQGICQTRGSTKPDFRITQHAQCRGRQPGTLTRIMHVQADRWQGRTQGQQTRHQDVGGLITCAVMQISFGRLGRTRLHGLQPGQKRRDANAAGDPYLPRAPLASADIKATVRPLYAHALAGLQTRGQAPGVIAQGLDLKADRVVTPIRTGQGERMRALFVVESNESKTALQPVVDGLVRAMRRIHAERQLTLTIEPFAASLGFRGEAQDLQEMLGNLVDNACKWAIHRVDIQARRNAETLIITVDDDGPGLAVEQRDRVMHRGVRADEQVPGSGLGLAIVDDLARLYGGQVTLTDSPLGGLRAALELPALL